MKLKGKAAAVAKKLNQQVKGSSKYINNPPHDGILALDKDTRQGLKTAAPCTALARTNPGVLSVKGGSALPALTPDAEGQVTALQERRKKFVGKHLPHVHCNVCKHTQVCPHYKPGYECAYVSQMMKKIESIEDVPEFMKLIAEAEMARVQQALIFDQLAGGDLTEETQLALDSVFNKLDRIYSLYHETHGNKPDAGLGLIKRLFGDLLPQKIKTVNVEDKSNDTATRVGGNPKHGHAANPPA